MAPSRGQSKEQEVDALLAGIREERLREHRDGSPTEPDRIERLRTMTADEFIPAFNQLKEKYAAADIEMELDATNFLQGGREISLIFGMGEFGTKLVGTVISEGIAFHETRYTPGLRGQVLSGPMLRVRTLTADVFKDFVCERLAILLRAVTHGRPR